MVGIFYILIGGLPVRAAFFVAAHPAEQFRTMLRIRHRTYDSVALQTRPTGIGAITQSNIKGTP